MRAMLRVLGVVVVLFAPCVGAQSESTRSIDGRIVLQSLRAWIGDAHTVSYNCEYTLRDGDGALIETQTGSVVLRRAAADDPTRKYRVRAVRTDAKGEVSRFESASDWRLHTLLLHDSCEMHQTHRAVNAAFPIEHRSALVLGQMMHPLAFLVEIDHGTAERVDVAFVGDALTHVVTMREAGSSQRLLIDAKTGALREIHREFRRFGGPRAATWRISNVRFDEDIADNEFLPVRPAGYAYMRATPAPYTGGEPRVGTMAPDLNFFTLEGAEVRLSDFEGKTVYLYWWSAACDPQLTALEALEKLHRAFADDGDVVVYGVYAAVDGEPELPATLLREKGFMFPVLIDTEQHWNRLGTNGLANDLLIGANGSPLRHAGSPNSIHMVERYIRRHMEAYRSWMKEAPL